MIAIVDYGAGNLKSVKKAFDHLGAEVTVTSRPEVIEAADKVVLPGVGHFSALSALDRDGLRDVLMNTAHEGKPFLGICLGMQWLFEGRCRAFSVAVKSPHVGWNSLNVRRESQLLRGIAADSFVYYTHSFQAPVVDGTTASSEYGAPFSAVVEEKNIFGVQFHPEKSWTVGLAMLKNFCETGP